MSKNLAFRSFLAFGLSVFGWPVLAECTHQDEAHSEGSYICHSGQLQECVNDEWQQIGSCARNDQIVQQVEPIIADVESRLEALGLSGDSFQGIKIQFPAQVDDTAAWSRFQSRQSDAGASPTAAKFCWIFYKGLKCKWDPC